MQLAELMIPVMNTSLVVGVGVVMPIAFRRRFGLWLLAAAGVAMSLLLSSGGASAGFLAGWLALTVREVGVALKAKAVVPVFLAGFALTAVLALVFSRMEWTLFGILEPIVKLTAVHFSYAGVGSLSLASRVADKARWPLVLAFVAPPVVALGFISRWALFQVGGAVLMSLPVLAVALVQLRDKSEPGRW